SAECSVVRTHEPSSVGGPPLRLTSRLIVEGDRWSLMAIERIEWPAIRPREISSRSANVSARRERHLDAGCMPPVSARIRWIEEWFRSNRKLPLRVDISQ